MEWKDPPADLTGHVVICNCNEKTGRIVDELQAAQLDPPVDAVLVIQQRDQWEANAAWHPSRHSPGRVFAVSGCPTCVDDLRRARLCGARAAVILADPAQGQLADARSTLVALAIEQEQPQVHSVMELLSSVSRVHLQTTEVNEVICLGEISEKLIAQNSISPGVKNIFARLLTAGRGTNSIFIVPLPEAALGTPYRAVARQLITSGAPVVLCGYIRAGAEPDAGGNADTAFVINPRAGDEPGKDTPLAADDLLVVLARRPPDLEAHLAGEQR